MEVKKFNDFDIAIVQNKKIPTQNDLAIYCKNNDTFKYMQKLFMFNGYEFDFIFPPDEKIGHNPFDNAPFLYIADGAFFYEIILKEFDLK